MKVVTERIDFGPTDYIMRTTTYFFESRQNSLSDSVVDRSYHVSDPAANPVGDRVFVRDPVTTVRPARAPNFANPRCFLPGTPILMADGSETPIERIRIGDLVMAFDPAAAQGRGALAPRRVTRTFRNTARTILDLRGLRMTPGHVCLTDGGAFETIAGILRRDGILVSRDGTSVRARTGAAAGSPEDLPVTILYADPATGHHRSAIVRAGIPLPAHATPHATLLDALAARGIAPHPITAPSTPAPPAPTRHPPASPRRRAGSAPAPGTWHPPPRRRRSAARSRQPR